MKPQAEYLIDPVVYPEKPGALILMQTHISWVFIGDAYLYKVKKPAEVACLSMHLNYNGYPELVQAFLEVSKEDGMRDILMFYKVYRAYVQDKVISCMLDEPGLNETGKVQALAKARSHYALAREYVMG
jgi:aminoglycoside phosphotransferase family enzyme